MTRVSMQLLGADQLVRNLTKYADRVLEGVVRASQIAQALVVNDARSDHPYVDRTQNLTNSIQPGQVEVTDKDVTAYVEARMAYASFVEFGTSRARAYPFLTPAMLRNAANYRRAIQKEVQAVKL